MSEKVTMGELEERVTMEEVVDKKERQKVEEKPTSNKAIEELLTVRLGNSPSKSLNLSKGLGSSSKPCEPFISTKPSQPLIIGPKKQEENSFSCMFCNKKFSNSQAFGGHQNAHKRERAILKVEKEKERNRFGFRSNPHICPHPTSNPNSLFQSRSPLYHGAKLHSMGHVANMMPSPLRSSGYPNQLRIQHPNINTTPQFGITNSWRPTTHLQKPSLIGDSSNMSSSERSLRSLQENAIESSGQSSSEELDLSLRL